MISMIQFETKSVQLLSVLLLLLTVSILTTSKDVGPLAFPTLCPNASDILPCTCGEPITLSFKLTCEGSSITQGDIDNLFKKVRAMTPNPEERLTIRALEIMNTTLKTLDMTPFLNTRFSTFDIHDNPLLTGISGPKVADGWHFEAVVLKFTNAALTDASLAALMKLADPSLGFVYLDDNKIEGNNLATAFAPFTGIYHLRLDGNQISTIGGGQFKHFKKLLAIYLGRNKITTLGQDAFLLDPEGMTGDYMLQVELQNNQLTDRGIHVQHGLDKMERKVVLKLDNNQFEVITAEKFYKFLLANTTMDNELWLFGNDDLICDEKLKWLQDANEEVDGQLENRVPGAYCKNDPKETIFTTKFPNNNNHGVKLQVDHVLSLVLFSIIANLLKSN